MVIPKEIHLLGPMPSGCVAVLEASPQLDDKGAVLGSGAGSDAGSEADVHTPKET